MQINPEKRDATCVRKVRRLHPVLVQTVARAHLGYSIDLDNFLARTTLRALKYEGDNAKYKGTVLIILNKSGRIRTIAMRGSGYVSLVFKTREAAVEDTDEIWGVLLEELKRIGIEHQ